MMSDTVIKAHNNHFIEPDTRFDHTARQKTNDSRNYPIDWALSDVLNEMKRSLIWQEVTMKCS